jgi:predicted TIM-barrel fold metal-dependent hydrolase
MRELADRPNAVCKISGLGLPFWGFRFRQENPAGWLSGLAEAWRPYVETAVDLFGAERCMMGSDDPPDSVSAGFVPLWNAFKHILAAAGSSEKASLFRDTAIRIYRIDL